MIKKCVGCGSTLQSTVATKSGYISSKTIEDALYCERCFKIINYGECDIINEKKDFEKIINNINSDDSAVVYLVDVLNINIEEINYLKKFKNKLIVLLTKKDVLPKSVKEKKIINYFKENYYNSNEIMCVSSFKKYNIDKFLEILKIKEINKIYVVGFTNAGKSTFINTLLSSVNEKSMITTSAVPNTTCDFINIKIGDLTIIDTPGFISKNSIYNYLNINEVLKIIPRKEIKVKTYQIKENQTIIIDNILRIDYLSKKSNSFSFYMNNNLNYKRMKIETTDSLKVLPKRNINIKGKEDLVIGGLGFIKITNPCDIVVYTLDENIISVRKNMI